MIELAGELRHAARRLLRVPSFTLPAVLTLGLAIAANGAIFTVAHRVVLNPLPYVDSARLIQIDHGVQALNIPNGLGLTPGLYFHYAERARTLERLAIYAVRDATLTGRGEPERVSITAASAELGPVLGAEPSVGRWFSASEATPGAARVALLSDRLWRRRYGSDAAILGRTITLDDVPTQVIGVLPASFTFPETSVDVWVPEPLTRSAGFGTWNYDAVARLREGVQSGDVHVELTGLIADVPQAFPADPLAVGQMQAKMFVNVTTLRDATIGNVATALWILLASVGVVLLVACANVANLFLVRTETRHREVAVRRALGAGNLGIIRYFLAESALLSLAGGAIGAGLAWAAVRVLIALGPANLPRLNEIRVDGIVVAFLIGLTALIALAFGGIPLLHGSASVSSLKESGRGGTASRGRHRTRHALMLAQVAMAVMLVISAGLIVRSFQRLRAVDPGFEPAAAVTFSLALPEREYSTRADAVATHQAVLDRLAALPTVSRVSAVSCLPFAGGCSGNTVQIEGRVVPPGTVPPLALFRAVAAGYFETMGMRLLRGRTLTRAEIDGAEPLVVVSRAFVDRNFPNESPLGRRIASNLPPLQPGSAPPRTWLTIVGVVADTPINTLGAPAAPHVYMPMSIAGGPDIPRLVGPSVAIMRYVVRSTTSASGLVPFIRNAVADVDAKLALADLRSLQSILNGATSQMAFTMVLMAIAAVVALTLGVVGVYGVVSYIVSRRTAEIGLRVALGARPRTVAAMILRQGGSVAGAGIALGLGGALAGGRLIESVLFEVSPRDPGVFAATTLALLAVALFACWLPARRAARLNPIEALRLE